MKLFFSGFFTSSLLVSFLVLTSCSSTPTLESLDSIGQASHKPTVTTSSAPPVSDNAQTYSEVARLSVGETVSIIFSGIPDLIQPHDEQIKEDGNITLPMIGPVKALGLTAGELQKTIHDLYVPKYYVRLNVVVKPSDLVYYVRGEVKQPGRQLYIGETTVTKAITSASDFTDFASHKVVLIRANGKRVKVNVDKALENSSLDLRVYPGDQIFVPRRIF